MLKSVAVSRHGPRSIATTLSPASVSCWAMIEPVQPRPMITASFLGSSLAISRLPIDGDGAFGIRLVVLADMIAIVVARAREADHLPARHALVAAIERIGEEAFHGVLQHQFEKLLGAEAGPQLQGDLAAVQPRQHRVLLIRRQGAKIPLAGGVGVIVQRPQTQAVAPRRRQVTLITLGGKARHEGTLGVEAAGLSEGAGQ